MATQKYLIRDAATGKIRESVSAVVLKTFTDSSGHSISINPALVEYVAFASASLSVIHLASAAAVTVQGTVADVTATLNS